MKVQFDSATGGYSLIGISSDDLGAMMYALAELSSMSKSPKVREEVYEVYNEIRLQMGGEK